MYYDINVSLNGRHFFATDKRSVLSHHDLRRVYPVIKAKFPESEGYKVSVTYREHVGTAIEDVDAYVDKEG